MNLFSNSVFKNIKPFYIYLFFLIGYIPYINYIDWGGDYAGYILQAKSILNRNITDEILKSSELVNLSGYYFSPNYYPWGFPFLIYLLSPIHNWNLLVIKFVMNAFLLFLGLIIFNKRESRNSYWIFVLFFHPSIYSISSESLLALIPASFFLICSIYFLDKNKPIISFLSFIFSTTIRPNFLIFAYMLFIKSNKKNRILLVTTILSFFLSNHFLQKIYSVSIYGDYSNSYGAGIKQQLLNLFNDFSLSQVLNIFTSLGELSVYVNTPLNIVFGICIFIFICTKLNNPIFLNILFFIFFNGLFTNISLVRMFTPILFLLLYDFQRNQYFLRDLLEIKYFKFVVISIMIILNLNNIQNSFERVTPLSEDYIEAYNFIYSDDSIELIGARKPRVLRLFTNKDSYKIRYEENKIPNSYILCEKAKEDCDNQDPVFENSSFKFYFEDSK